MICLFRLIIMKEVPNLLYNTILIDMNKSLYDIIMVKVVRKNEL